MSVNAWCDYAENSVHGTSQIPDLAWRLMDSLAAPLVALTSDHRICYLNKAAEQILNETFSSVFDKNWTEVIRLFYQGKPVETITQCESTGHHNLPEQDAWYLMQKNDGSMIPVRLSIANISESPEINSASISIVIHDVGSIKTVVDHLIHQSTHDVLTGIVNRLEIDKRITRLLEKTAEPSYSHSHALLFMDLDGFKIVNDVYGHQAGDEILRQVAKLFNSIVRERDTIARYGGDEFVLLLEHCSIKDAVAAARMLRIMLHEYALNWQGNTINIDVSIGIIAIDHKYDDLKTIVAKADEACYKAKRSLNEKIFAV